MAASRIHTVWSCAVFYEMRRTIMGKTKRCQLQKILTKLFGKWFYIVGHEEYEQREESYRQKEAE